MSSLSKPNSLTISLTILSSSSSSSSLLEDLPQSFSSLVLSKSVCLPLSVKSLAFSVHLMALKTLTRGETNHLCFHGKAWLNQGHF